MNILDVGPTARRRGCLDQFRQEGAQQTVDKIPSYLYRNRLGPSHALGLFQGLCGFLPPRVGSPLLSVDRN